MIDFENASFLKLRLADNRTYASMIAPMFVDGEEIIATFQSIRDGVVFTSKRIITINIQGVTGMKKDFTSLPYSKIQSFSVETAGMFDIDSELVLWFAGMGKITLEFTPRTNISAICKVISDHTL